MRIVDFHEKVDLIRRAGWEAHQQALSNLQEVEGLDELHEKFDAKLVGLKKMANKFIGVESNGASFQYGMPPKTSPSNAVTNLTIATGMTTTVGAIERLRDALKTKGWGLVDTQKNNRHKINNNGKSWFTKAIAEATALVDLYSAYEEDIDEDDAPATTEDTKTSGEKKVSEMNTRELKDLAKSKKIKGYSGMNKAELIKALS